MLPFVGYGVEEVWHTAFGGGSTNVPESFT